MKFIRMKAVIEFKTKEVITDMKDLSYEVGGFAFMLPNPITKELVIVPFDFNAFSATGDLETMTVTYETGQGLLFNEDCISEDYRESIEVVGFDINTIDAELLASTPEIYEFHFAVLGQDYLDLTKIKIKELTFSDGETEYSVDSDVIIEYNRVIQEELK